MRNEKFYAVINVYTERGVRAKVQHLNFFASFWSNFRPLGLENSSNLIIYPQLWITKLCNDMY